ncbi:2OG-Fe(II) oxygenase [Polyangium aurulentum]|uniref:2OG-Fe(II) oxygenase n=1 Tax=Polyangium aurulentum TaxID=2567896 RepID=UPI0010AEAE7A|nr:2OG-Fe(II) oxygenase [Polyangium aurulentum]UQA58795.1 2OG-Fe(II) oxygenase [Polyangium aurulentum]
MDSGALPLRRLSTSPRIYLQEGFASEDEIRHVLARAERDALVAAGLDVTEDATGMACEIPVEGDPVLAALAARIEAILTFACALPGPSFRFRRYARGDAHPPHVDTYTIAGAQLVATALVYLTDAEEGGETYFPHASPEPIALAPRRGQLAIWFNHAPDGRVDRSSEHESKELTAGEKATITYFVYAPLEAAKARLLPDDPEPPQASGVPARTLFCVNDHVPEETTRLLREACEARGVGYVEIDASTFDFIDTEPLPPGAMLFRPAISVAGIRAEQVLWAPGVATFYREPDGILRNIGPTPLIYERAGLPVPRWIWGNTTSRDTLRRYVEWLGGLPIIMKFLGSSRGIGVLRIDTLPGLFSTMDHALSSGYSPLLMSYVPDATHWRVIVVGDRVAGFYRNRTEEDDFRTYASEDPDDYRTPPSPEILATAIRAVEVQEVELGGVDILEHPSGRHYLLEVNFPCYFASARLVGGHDVAGAMIDWLVKKAERLAG